MDQPDPMPPILYWSRSLAIREINLEGPWANLPGVIDLTIAHMPYAMVEGEWQLLPELPADAVWMPSMAPSPGGA